MEETQTEQKKNNNLMTGFIIIAIVAALSLGIFVFATKSQKQTATETTQTTTPASTKQTSYKDGTYTQDGDYVSPGGPEQLGVTITLKNDVITDANVESKATLPNSIKFQGLFISGYKPLVIGKNINEVMLTKVSGSSLAPKGFNDAIEKIKTQAKS